LKKIRFQKYLKLKSLNLRKSDFKNIKFRKTLKFEKEKQKTEEERIEKKNENPKIRTETRKSGKTKAEGSRSFPKPEKPERYAGPFSKCTKSRGMSREANVCTKGLMVSWGMEIHKLIHFCYGLWASGQRGMLRGKAEATAA
jgi:hypothetical protein